MSYRLPVLLMPTEDTGGQTSPAWQHAVRSVVSRLPPAQRAMVALPANADDCISLLVETQRRKSKLMRLLSLMKSAIEPLKKFEGAIDVLVQVNAGIASPIWGPLRIAITRFNKYETLFKESLLVQQAIGALYCDYLDFCTRVITFYASSSIRAFFADFEKDFQDVSENIRHHSQNVDWAANAAHIEETQKEMESAKRERLVHEMGNIQRWLSPTTVEDDLAKHLRDCFPGSCDWLLKMIEHNSHLQSDKDIKLTLKGIEGPPGSGKSTLTAFVVDRLMQQGLPVVYFFAKANDREKCRLIHILRSILAQLLRQDESLYTVVDPVYRQSGRATADSLVEVQRALNMALESTRKNTLFFVIDALDECEDTELLLEWLDSLKERGRACSLHVFCTTRPTLGLKNLSLLKWAHFRAPEISQKSIEQYLGARVDAILALRGSRLSQEVVNSISVSAHGLWLYARLAMDEIGRLPGAASISTYLHKLPRGIAELYTRLIRTAEADFNDTELALARQLYLWLDSSDRIPEGRVDVQYKLLSLVFQFANNGEPVLDTIAVARQFSYPLIEVNTSSSTIPSSLKKRTLPIYEVEFIHHSAKQYLEQSASLPAEELPSVIRPRRLRHLYRGMASIWYFTSCHESEEELTILRSSSERFFPIWDSLYFDMAYGLWDFFRQPSIPTKLGVEEVSDVTEMLQKMTDFITTPACLRWLESAIAINYSGDWDVLFFLAMDSHKAATDGQDHGFEPFAKYCRISQRFFHTLSFVFFKTGPWLKQEPPEHLMIEPEGFAEDQLAGQIWALGSMWQAMVKERQKDGQTSS
ncbi:hypothetical protein HJFPF1_07368 [Paramyrothecium foliicola]|nr:hypothetical protein HJFPF1_07368 [Paramyrothecium foliicola]